MDEGIEKVEQEIEHTERLKKGLTQRLLIRGIGHKEFKDSPIGKIPKDWEVVKLGKIAKVKYGLSQPPKLKDDGVPMIRATNIKKRQNFKERNLYG